MMLRFTSTAVILLISGLFQSSFCNPQADVRAICGGAASGFKCVDRTHFVLCNGLNSISQSVALGTECINDQIVYAGRNAASAPASAPVIASISTAAPTPITIQTTSSVGSTNPVPAGTSQTVATNKPSVSTYTLSDASQVLSFLGSFSTAYPSADLVSISQQIVGTNKASTQAYTFSNASEVLSFLSKFSTAYSPANMSSISQQLLPKPSGTGSISINQSSATPSGVTDSSASMTITVVATVTGTKYVTVGDMTGGNSVTAESNLSSKLSATVAVPSTIASTNSPSNSASTVMDPDTDGRTCKTPLPNHDEFLSLSTSSESASAMIKTMTTESSSNLYSTVVLSTSPPFTGTATVSSVVSSGAAPIISPKYPTLISTLVSNLTSMLRGGSTTAGMLASSMIGSTQSLAIQPSTSQATGFAAPSLEVTPASTANPAPTANTIVPVTP